MLISGMMATVLTARDIWRTHPVLVAVIWSAAPIAVAAGWLLAAGYSANPDDRQLLVAGWSLLLIAALVGAGGIYLLHRATAVGRR